MQAVKVQYTVREEYVETNKANIAQVMADLRAVNNPNLRYSAFLMDDGKTFVHIVMRGDDEAQKTLTELPAFQEFQRQLRGSQPEAPPHVETLALVGSSWDLF